MKRILKYLLLYPLSICLWFNWWTTAIISICILLIISFFIPKKAYNPLVKIVNTILIYCILFIPKIKGIKPKDVPFPVIFVGNHVSFFDLFISGSILPGNPRGLELKSHFSKPVYGWFITKFGEIPIDTSSKGSIRHSFEKVEELLHNKIRNIFIMPEGSRTFNGKISKFKSGAFYLSKKTGIPIVPVVYKGLFNRNNRTSITIIPGSFEVIIMPPVYPEKFDKKNDMSEYVKKIMQEKLDEK